MPPDAPRYSQMLSGYSPAGPITFRYIALFVTSAHSNTHSLNFFLKTYFTKHQKILKMSLQQNTFLRNKIYFSTIISLFSKSANVHQFPAVPPPVILISPNRGAFWFLHLQRPGSLSIFIESRAYLLQLFQSSMTREIRLLIYARTVHAMTRRHVYIEFWRGPNTLFIPLFLYYQCTNNVHKCLC